MKLKLYLDFDGVILDTAEIADKKMIDLNLTEIDEIENYYKNIDWYLLMKEAKQINNSLANIKKLIDSNLYDVEILTHVNSEVERKLKEEYINKYFPKLKIISVSKEIEKCDAVIPENSILVDDYIENLHKWQDKGGIPIKFSDKGKSCKYKSISNLSKLIDLYDELLQAVATN